MDRTCSPEMLVIDAALHHEALWSFLNADWFWVRHRNSVTSFLLGLKNGCVKRVFCLKDILFVLEPDIETLNIQLEKFGHQLYKAGRPYNHYVDSQRSDRSPTKDSKVNATSMGSCLCLVTL